MAFILDAQRSAGYEEMTASFRRYQNYLATHRDRFPPNAYALATSDWYYRFDDHRSPHDAWLEEAALHEGSAADQPSARVLSLRIRLLGAYHDGHIELIYPVLFRYELGYTGGAHGHRDWRYDEFRLTDSGRVEHEIEWSGAGATGRWVIEASDVVYRWLPAAAAPGRNA